MQDYPIIALVGRPNVGKSVLFNRLIGRREAITSHEAGTTRDRHFGVMRWFGHAWTLVDTAGMLFDETEEQDLEDKALQQAMEEQVSLAAEEADVIGLVVDIKAGIQPGDLRLAELLRKYHKPLIILANKADNYNFRLQAEEFHTLGSAQVFAISAIHGTGLREVIDYIQSILPSPASQTESELPRVTFIGRPNVGKSTLLNTILNTPRAIVSETPGTTRDTIEAEAELPTGEKIIVVDTAGIRRRGKIEPGIEKFSLFRTLKAINQSDVVVILLTIEEAPTRGDAHIASYAEEAGKKIIIALNKADMARDPILKMKAQDQQKLGNQFLRRFVFMQRLPLYFISAKTGQGVKELTAALAQALPSQS